MSAPWSSEALWLLTGGAAFAAGVLNAIAGGGSFLTFPALVFAGVPPLAANATSAMADDHTFQFGHAAIILCAVGA